MAHFFGLTSTGEITTAREYVAEETGHTAMYGIVDGDWCVDVRGPGGSEHLVYEADVPVAIRAHQLGLECAEDAIEEIAGHTEDTVYPQILRTWHADTESGDEDALGTLCRRIGIDGDDAACQAIADVFRRAYSDRLCRAAREWAEREQYGLPAADGE